MGDVADYAWQLYYYPGKGYHIGALQANSEPDMQPMAAYVTGNGRYESFQTKRGPAERLPPITTWCRRAKNYMWCISISPAIPGRLDHFRLGDDAKAEGASAPTNGQALFPPWALAAYEAGKWYDIPMFAEIPAGKYPYLYGEAGKCGARIVGVEVE